MCSARKLREILSSALALKSPVMSPSTHALFPYQSQRRVFGNERIFNIGT